MFSYNYNSDTISFTSQRIIDQYVQCLHFSISDSNKLETYCLFKNNFEFEKYLMVVENLLHRGALTKLRCSSHKLAIVEGRFRNIDKQNRQ